MQSKNLSQYVSNYKDLTWFDPGLFGYPGNSVNTNYLVVKIKF